MTNTAGHRRPTPLLIVAMIASSGMLISIISVVLSVTALQRQIDDSTRAALCQVWEFYIPQPGEPPPSTDRGQSLAEKARQQAHKLSCPGR